jgi:hypothetical protein
MACRAVRNSRVTETAPFDGLEVHVGRRRQKQVVAPMLVHERRTRPPARQHVVNGGQGLEIGVDLGGKVFSLGTRGRNAHGDQLADVADFAGGENGLNGRLEPGQRGVGPDRRDAVQILSDEDAVADGRRNLDRLDARVRQGASQKRHLQHAGQADVADVLAPAAHVAVVLLAQQPRADALLRHVALRNAVIRKSRSDYPGPRARMTGSLGPGSGPTISTS